MNITVFCSANSLDDRYTAPAAEFARLLGEGGHTLVWGGSNAGLMGQLADGVKAVEAASWSASWSSCWPTRPTRAPTSW